MLSSADAALDAVVQTIIALERSCLDADAALVEQRWTDAGAAFAVQHELTARLADLFETSPRTAPANDAKVARRIDGILAYRHDQLRRLQTYRDDVATRLSSIGKVNAFSRSFGKHAHTAHLLDGQY
jgi:hypothetical protein